MKHRGWKWLGVAVAVAVLIVAAFFINLHTFQPDRTRFPVRGIDVSHHQGVIDWSAVSADDVSFAYVKVSEGGDHRDTRYRENIAGAAAVGIPVGAYHYFTFCRPGAEQADNYLAAVESLDPDLPPVVDLEYQGNCSYRPTREEMGREVAAFVTGVESALGRQVHYYLAEDFRFVYGSALPPRPLWYRLIAFEPFYLTWRIWQYDDDATVAGIAGPVDLNVISGELSEFVGLN